MATSTKYVTSFTTDLGGTGHLRALLVTLVWRDDPSTQHRRRLTWGGHGVLCLERWIRRVGPANWSFEEIGGDPVAIEEFTVALVATQLGGP